MILYKSKFLEVNYLELQYLMHFNWTSYAGYMDSNGVFHQFTDFLSKRIYKRANQIYIDWRNIEHLINQETSDWFFKYILPKISSHKPYRLAFLLNNTKTISIHNEIKVNNKYIKTKIFDNSVELMQWLMDGAKRKSPGTDEHNHNHKNSCKKN